MANSGQLSCAKTLWPRNARRGSGGRSPREPGSRVSADESIVERFLVSRSALYGPKTKDLATVTIRYRGRSITMVLPRNKFVAAIHSGGQAGIKDLPRVQDSLRIKQLFDPPVDFPLGRTQLILEPMAFE